MVVSVGLLGAVIGSFLNVVIHRLPRRESVVFPASRCTSCGVRIAPLDNVPILSWLALGGRCRGCGEAISKRYPAVELLTALLFTAVVLVRGFDADLVLELPMMAMLVAVGGIDLEHRVIPNRILAPGAVLAVVVTAIVRPEQLAESLIAATGALAFLLVAALAYRGGMGMGDVKLAGVMGLYLGLSIVPALAVAVLAGSLVGVAMIVRDGPAARKSGVPFGPFLALGGCTALLAGPELIELYTRTFLS